jgi:hypothetical protein
MNLIRSIGREILGLFLDDEFLAVAALMVAGATAILVKALHAPPLLAGMAFLGGSVAVLCLSIWRTARAG